LVAIVSPGNQNFLHMPVSAQTTNPRRLLVRRPQQTGASQRNANRIYTITRIARFVIFDMEKQRNSIQR